MKITWKHIVACGVIAIIAYLAGHSCGRSDCADDLMRTDSVIVYIDTTTATISDTTPQLIAKTKLPASGRGAGLSPADSPATGRDGGPASPSGRGGQPIANTCLPVRQGQQLIAKITDSLRRHMKVDSAAIIADYLTTQRTYLTTATANDVSVTATSYISMNRLDSTQFTIQNHRATKKIYKSLKCPQNSISLGILAGKNIIAPSLSYQHGPWEIEAAWNLMNNRQNIIIQAKHQLFKW